MHASGPPDSGTPDDVAGLTVRAGFWRWPWPFPWRPFREGAAPEIVELITRGGAARGRMLNGPDQAGNLLETLKEGGVGICAAIGNDDLPPAPDKASQGPGPSLASVPWAAAVKLGDGKAVRFPLSRLVNRVVTLDLRSPDKDQVDVLREELHGYWKSLRPGNAPTPGLVSVIVAVLRAFPNPASMLAELIDGLVRRHFRLWFWGVPGLGSECRWLRRQWKQMLPGETFEGFLLAMTAAPPEGNPGRTQPRDARNAELLAARALLEDLRAACQPRLWSPRTWDRFIRRPVLILDNLRDDRFPHLLATARGGAGRQRGTADPLLIVLVPRSRRGGHLFSCREVHKPGDPKHVTYQQLRRPRLAQAEFGAVPLCILALLALVPLAQSGLLPAGPWQHLAEGVPTANAATAGPRLPLPAGPCPVRASGDGDTQVIPWNDPSGGTECVGFSDGSYTFTNNDSGLSTEQQLQEARLTYDQRQVFASDNTLTGLARGRVAAGEGPVYKIVYFAGLTEGPLDEYDSAEAEEMEGLLVAQRTAAYGPGATGNSVNLRNAQLEVIIANGGSKMQDAAQVARMIIKTFANDPYFLGVAGMDRSTGQVQEAIDDFTASRIPVVATTLSGDERLVKLASGGKLVPGPIGGDSPYYFQLGATNTAEASLIMRYVRDAVPRYFEQPFNVYPSNGSVTPQKIVIYEPEVPSANDKNNDPDLYISSMVADLLAAGKEYHQSYRLPMPTVTQNVIDPDLCGASTVVIFAGRHDRPLASASENDDFTTFLTRIAQCASTAGDKNVPPLDRGNPFIIADDGVARFIADTADRAALPQVRMPISYVSKGVRILSTGTNCLNPGPATAVFAAPMNTFCSGYATVASQMTRNVTVGRQHPKLLWTGERVGLAYDAAQLFLQGADAAWDNNVPFTRQGVPAAFKAPDVNASLVTGSVNFTAPPYIGVDSPNGMPLAVLRIHISDQETLPACQFSSLSGYRLAPIPNMDKDAAACLGKSN